jgi:16S rRNA (guanine527-N7)-methyltransferase
MSATARRHANALPPEFGPEEFAQATGVSRETLMRLKAHVGLLGEWNERHNLVARSTMVDVWCRHVWDSAQLTQYIPDDARNLADLGSGAGFPGLALAILLRDRPRFRSVLFESTGKKADFLRLAATAARVDVEVRNARIEDGKPERFDIITARACAPLTKLLGYAQPFQAKGTVNLFLKGQNVEAELTEARKIWKMKVERHQSLTDSSGTILEIRELAHVRSKR